MPGSSQAGSTLPPPPPCPWWCHFSAEDIACLSYHYNDLTGGGSSGQLTVMHAICASVSVCSCVFSSQRPIYEWSCNSGTVVLQVKVQWTGSQAGCMISFFLSLQDVGRVALISSGGLPASLSKPHQLHAHTCMHAHKHAVCATRTDFMSKVHQLSMAYLMRTGCSSL